MFWFLLLVIALILYGSLYPWHLDFSRAADPLGFLLHSWPRRWGRFALRGIVANILFYIPLGAVAFLAFARRTSRAMAVVAAVVLGMLLSASVEILQLYIPGRDCGILDVLTNTTGAALGALAALAYQREIERRWMRPGARPASSLAAPLLLLACWLGFQLFPFVPRLHPTLLFRGFLAMLRPASISGVEIWANAAEWLAAAVALEAIMHRRPGLRWLILAMLCLPLRTLIFGRTLPVEAVLGALAALLVWCALPPSRRHTAAVWALASAILLREFAPFHFASRAAPFSWVPFAAAVKANRQSGVLVLLRKAYDYGALVWLLRLYGIACLRAGALLAAVLAIGEDTQRYLPGRTPEITDPLLALVMSLIVKRLINPRNASPKSPAGPAGPAANPPTD